MFLQFHNSKSGDLFQAASRSDLGKGKLEWGRWASRFPGPLPPLCASSGWGMLRNPGTFSRFARRHAERATFADQMRENSLSHHPRIGAFPQEVGLKRTPSQGLRRGFSWCFEWGYYSCGSPSALVSRTGSGKSPEAYHFMVSMPLRYHFPLEGRRTPMSVSPSPS